MWGACNAVHTLVRGCRLAEHRTAPVGAAAVMPCIDSITNGIGGGFLAFAVPKLLAGRIRAVHPLMLGASPAFLVYSALGR